MTLNLSCENELNFYKQGNLFTINIKKNLFILKEEFIMATTFLAGVANAEIFKDNDLFATAKTLID